MGSDESKDGELDWKEFIRGQAFYIICSRTNKYGSKITDSSLSNVAFVNASLHSVPGASTSGNKPGASKGSMTKKKTL